MSRTNQIISIVIAVFILSGCTPVEELSHVKVKNNLSVDRTSETVEIELASLTINSSDFSNIVVKNQTSGEAVLSQLVDNDKDGNADLLLFKADVAANSEAIYTLVPTNDSISRESKVYSRFVPERTDDYAWENDKVAFRTFGPVAQQMIEEGIEGGTLSSGMDCWLKKVDYPIINKWYGKVTDGTGTYHEDTGEGLDNFHVGTSRGCGGLGVYLNDELYTSKNFTAYATLSNGPIRTEFTLDYANWKAEDLNISEQKKISLDLGSNLMHVEARVFGTQTITVGLTLHENDGETSVDTLNGYFSYWQPQADSELGTAIICHSKYYLGYTKAVSEENDKSQLLVHLKVIDGVVEYYTGFAWKESKQYPNKEAWETYLNGFSQRVAKPLEVEVY